MGKYMRKCKGIRKLAVMEVSQAVGVRTRAMTTALAEAEKAAKRRKAAGSTAAEYQIAYLQLRSRSLVMTVPPTPRSGAKSPGSCSPRCSTPDRGEISLCESNASCGDVAELRPDDPAVGEDSESSVYFSSLRKERGVATPSSQQKDHSYDLESTAELRPPQRSADVITPPEADIEDFFAAAEKKEAQRFARTYNYDVVNDVPLEGRYEWVPV